jgi:integrase
LDQVLEYKAETLEKEIALRMMKAGRKVSPGQKEKIKQEATRWVENGVQATTDKRLRILRAMLGFLAKRGMIHKNDIPAFPIKGAAVDNKNRTFLGEKDLKNLVSELDGVFHPFVKFLYATGMRSGQASKLTWDMVDKNCTQLHVPGELTKNGEDFVLPLVYQNGEPMFDFVKDIQRMVRTPHEPIFETADFRSQWRQACHKLGLGVFNKETRAYRGAKPHDFRRTACRNMVIAGIPQPVAMAISGHKTDSIFRRYAIMDKTAVQQAFETLQAR